MCLVLLNHRVQYERLNGTVISLVRSILPEDINPFASGAGIIGSFKANQKINSDTTFVQSFALAR